MCLRAAFVCERILLKASQLNRETSSREAKGLDSAKFALQLQTATTLHATPDQARKLEEVEAAREDKMGKEKGVKKQPLAERLLDLPGA